MVNIAGVNFLFFNLQHVDGSFSVKPLKQKQIVGPHVTLVTLCLTLFVCSHLMKGACVFVRARAQVDRVSYLLQEIYGIENKNNQETKVSTPTSFIESIARRRCFWV